MLLEAVQRAKRVKLDLVRYMVRTLEDTHTSRMLYECPWGFSNC